MLFQVDGPVTLVAHSLGSVIAYDVLSQQPFEDLEVKLFVTIGSPLGIQELQDEISKPLEVCQPVRAWYNFSDALDIVALDKTLSEEFEPYGTVFDCHVNNPSWNGHTSSGYLRNPLIRRIVKENGTVVLASS